MAQKSNIRSIRISDQMAELIDQQAGNNFTEKWENLVTRCVWELPAKERELNSLAESIQRKRDQYYNLIEKYNKLESTIREISYRATALGNILNQESKKWDDLE